MKKGWQTKTLGEVCDVVNGGTPKTGVPEYWDGNHRWITPAEMGKRLSPYVSDTERKITDLGLRDSSARMLPPNSVILSSRAPIGHLVINTERMGTNQGCKGLIPRNQIEHKFLYYYLTSIVDLLNSLGTGATFKELSGGKLKEVEIPVPPLADQQRVAGLLDKAFEDLATAKANAEKNLQNARALFESHLQSVLRSKKWKWKTLGDLSDDVEYGSSAKSKKEGKVPVLRMGNIQGGQLDWENLVYTDDKDEIKKYLLKPNDVLFNRTNSPELVGKTAIYRGETPAIFAGYLIRINRKEELLDADFLTYFLNSQIAFDYGKTVVISSVNQANINGTKLKGYPIPAPSLSEQKTIVAKLNSLSEETQRLASIDARNVRNIVLMRPVNSMIEFKQIIGRGTRLYDGKDYFTIFDFVKAYQHFSDPEWDGEPVEPEEAKPRTPRGGEDQPSPPPGDDGPEPEKPQKLKIKLADGKERAIQHMTATTFWSTDGTPMSAAQFVERLFGELPALFKDEDELRTLWSDPGTRKALLEALAEKGFGAAQLVEIKQLIDADKSDLYDVLAYIAFALSPITREERVSTRKGRIFSEYDDDKLRAFLDFVLSEYVKEGVGELDQSKLTPLLELKYRAVSDAASDLGGIARIRDTFIGFQKYLYADVRR